MHLGVAQEDCMNTHMIHLLQSFHSQSNSVTNSQGCGLGLDVSVSRRTNVSYRSHLEKNYQCLGLSHLRVVPETNFRPNCAGHSTQCERALDVVSLCCSYYCSSY